MLKRISEHRTEKVTGFWRKLYNEELQQFVLLSNIIIKTLWMRWGHAARKGEQKNAYKFMQENLKRPVGRQRHKLGGNNKIILK
jgi:hypothetical protein